MNSFKGCRDGALIKYDDHKSDPDLVADAVVGVCSGLLEKVAALHTGALDLEQALVFRQSYMRGAWVSVRKLVEEQR